MRALLMESFQEGNASEGGALWGCKSSTRRQHAKASSRMCVTTAASTAMYERVSTSVAPMAGSVEGIASPSAEPEEHARQMQFFVM